MNQLAKSIVDLATECDDQTQNDGPVLKDKKKQQAGRLGGKKRSETLTPKKRQEIAKAAAQKRWASQKT